MSLAYIPECLQYGSRTTLSNAHRAQESIRAGFNTIRNLDLKEVFTLNSVLLIVAEYVLFSAN